MAAEGSGDDVPPLREQTIYVPYDKLRETFEKTGRGVFIPYARFEELWQAARAAQQKTAPVQPPAPALIAEADNDATLGKDVVHVVAKLKIDILAQGWVTVPLRLGDAGIVSAMLVEPGGQEQPARLAVAPDGGYQLLYENTAKGPRQISLRLEYAKAFTKSPGRNDVAFAAPQAPLNRWRVHIAESAVKIHIDPLIAASEVPGGAEEQPGDGADKKPADAAAAKPDGDKPADAKPTDEQPVDKQPAGGKAVEETVLLAFVGAASTVKIDWTAKAEGASGMAALATVMAQQTVRIEEAAVRTRVTLVYTISRAELDRLTIEVPGDQKVASVTSPNLRAWAVEAAGETQKIVAELFEPARQSETIEIELEQFAAPAAAARASGCPGG